KPSWIEHRDVRSTPISDSVSAWLRSPRALCCGSAARRRSVSPCRRLRRARASASSSDPPGRGVAMDTYIFHLHIGLSFLLASCTIRSARFSGVDSTVDSPSFDGTSDAARPDDATTQDTAPVDLAALPSCDPSATDLVACYEFEPSSPLSVLVDDSIYG